MGFWVPDDAPPPAAASLVIALTTLRMRACVRVDTSLVSAATMLRMHARMRVCAREVCVRACADSERGERREARTDNAHAPRGCARREAGLGILVEQLRMQLHHGPCRFRELRHLNKRAPFSDGRQHARTRAERPAATGQQAIARTSPRGHT